MFTLRYYCQGKETDGVIKLLDQIKEKWNIQYESLNLSTNGKYDEKKEERTYLTDFKPRSRVLKMRTGKSIYKELRGKHGSHHYYISIPGTIAIAKQGRVEWYTVSPGGFLKDVLDLGPDSLEKLC